MAIVRPTAGPLGWRDPDWPTAAQAAAAPVVYYGPPAPEPVVHYGPPAPEAKKQDKKRAVLPPKAAPATGNRAIAAAPPPVAPPPEPKKEAFFESTLGQLAILAGITKLLKVW